MKLNQFLKLFLFLAIGIMTFTSCEDDGTGGTGGTGNGPNVSFDSNSGQDLTINPAEVFTIRVNATKGDTDLKTVTVFEDGTAISFDRLTFNGDAASANPRLLFGDEKTSFTYDIGITAHSDVSGKVYAVEVSDEGNLKKSVSLVVTTNATPPTLTYNGPATFDAAANSAVSLNVVATAGSGKIATIAVYENGVLIADPTRLDIAGNAFDANPYALPEALQAGFDDNLILRTGMAFGPTIYIIEVTDEFGGIAIQEITINIGTPLDDTLTGVLFNKSGPVGTGGLDLDAAVGTGSASMLAEIRDEGNVSTTSTNWKKQVAGVNGSEMRYVVKGQNGVSEDFTFDGVSFKDQVTQLFDAGVPFTATNSAGESVSNVVVVGDIFSVKNGDKYYLLQVTAVTETTNDNMDSYTMSIKK